MSTEIALNYNLDLPDLGLSTDGKPKSEGIGILVDMAKAGKIDPWNIDIVDVTDKYLAHMVQMKSQSYRQNLLICRNTFEIKIKCSGRC